MQTLEDQTIDRRKPYATESGKLLKVKIFDRDDVFERLEEEWKDLAGRSDAMVFMTFEWVKLWWRHFGVHPRRSLYVVTLWDSGKLVALAPFYQARSSFGSRVMENRLQLIGSGGGRNEQFGFRDDYGISDFLDILVDEAYRQPAAQRLSGILPELALRLETDYINLLPVREDSFVMRYLYPLMKEKGVDIQAEKRDVCPRVDLSSEESFKGFVKGVKSNARRRFRQTQRAVKAGDLFDIEEITTRSELDEAIDSLIHLHQNRWNQIGFPGVFYDRRFTSFFKELTENAFEKGRLWFKVARDAEGVCAARMILCYNGRYFDYISGFDDNRQSAKARPGIALLLDLVREAIQEGDKKSLELLRGEEPYKYDFTKTSVTNWGIRIHCTSGSSIWKEFQSTILSWMAILYSHMNRELNLMNVQRLQKGVLRMLPGYLRFRWESVKIRLRERNRD